MRNDDSGDWLTWRLGIVLALWAFGSVLLALAARTGASLLALFITLLGALSAYTWITSRERNLPPPVKVARQPSMATAASMPLEARHFIEREFAAAQRGRPLALVIFGFPGFSRFAEQAGPAAADAAVVEFGRVLNCMTRKMNLSARCGWRAEAFLSVLSDADGIAARKFIARVREGSAELGIPMPEIEAGVAVYKPHMQSPEELVAEAEQELAAVHAEAVARQPSPSAYGPRPLAPMPGAHRTRTA